MALKFTSNYPTIVCLGDSQTQQASSPLGFVAALADTYQRRADVINRGFNGYTTRDVVPIASDFLTRSSSSKPNIIAVTLWLGCNDSINETEKQYVSPEDFVSNLHKILDAIVPSSSSEEDSPYVLVVSPTPVMKYRPFHTNERKELYTSLVEKVVNQRAQAQQGGGDKEKNTGKVQFLNAFELFMHHEKPLSTLLDEDGLHISPDGYKVLSEAFKQRLRAQPGLDPETMPSIYPDWKTF